MTSEILPRPPSVATERALALGERSAVAVLLGALLSGPVAMLVVTATRPQPAWSGPAEFARHFALIQTLPFFLGFCLVLGFVALVASLHVLSNAEHRPATTLALALAAAFSALVFFNYLVQTTFVPSLARGYSEANGPILAALTMANPTSLGWSIELWAYGVLGLSTWLVAPVFDRGRLEHATRALFIINGPASIGPAILTAFVPGWALTLPGLVGFGAWNLLVIGMATLSILVFRKRRRTLAKAE